ncbi:MgtC/SapB family protein [Bradyrhizobium jicamae]|uniref:MgtC/SapB family protein n=1 Tax=Bradyrhizobium jicamae TaxID=280332 RepID=UPI001BA8F16B|nr:MgtC/SapB family protein [Bradyrhizobium jicamae]MBR0932458.1 MgtC/SapB family protein [Bradyrhizobium jicamae]
MPGEPIGQGWLQLGELGLAFVLSAMIGLEREIRQKSAGLRTYTLVGFASALFLLVSKYGFTNILEANRIVLDPSRIAAQIVTGIGFIGGGVIFVRKDIVRGLTTAATVWLTSAVGMACGVGLPILAIAVTAGHMFIVAVLPAVERRLPKSRWAPSRIHVTYRGRLGVLRQVLTLCTQHDFVVSRVNVEGEGDLNRHGRQSGGQQARGHGKEWGDETAPVEEAGDGSSGAADVVTLLMEVRGTRSIPKLAARIAEIPGVVAVQAGDAESE